jgi:hypothetical protein
LEFANKRNTKAILRWLLGRQDWSPFSPEQVEFAELNFDFHPHTVRSILQAHGFDIRKRLTVSHFRIELLKRWIPLYLLVTIDSWLQWTGAWWQLTPSVFLQAVVPGALSLPALGPIFCCPECEHEPLDEQPQGLLCAECGCLWGYHEGIYDFKVPLRKGSTRE